MNHQTWYEKGGKTKFTSLLPSSFYSPVYSQVSIFINLSFLNFKWPQITSNDFKNEFEWPLKMTPNNNISYQGFIFILRSFEVFWVHLRSLNSIKVNVAQLFKKTEKYNKLDFLSDFQTMYIGAVCNWPQIGFLFMGTYKKVGQNHAELSD